VRSIQASWIAARSGRVRIASKYFVTFTAIASRSQGGQAVANRGDIVTTPHLRSDHLVANYQDR
jgi:hypothetical protein